MVTFTRRLLPILFSGLLLVPLASTVAAEDLPSAPADDAALLQDGVDLVHMTNAKRESVGRVDLRMDPALMSIARDRARVMAANDVLSHTEPDGKSFVDRINAAHLTWYAAGEIIAWNHYPAQYSTAEAISAWWGSPGHHAIMASSGYNYVGFGAAMSADGKYYYAGVFAKMPDHTVPWARMGSVSMRTVDAQHKRVTVRWSGGDTRLQVLTSGLRYFQVQWRAVGGSWHAWTTSTATSKSITMVRGVRYEARVRARDNAGNWGAWRMVSLRP